jgi:two-component system, NarL family, response regulator DevR
MSAIRILIVDDHPMLRRGLRSLLMLYPDMNVVGEAEDSVSALEMARGLLPEIILLDVKLPGPDGVQTAFQLRREVPDAKIIILTAYNQDDYLTSALRAGVYAYLLKSTSDDTLVSSIRMVHEGKHLLAPELIDTVLQQFEILAKANAQRESGLTANELTVLGLIAQGASNKEIGNQMFWSERTVKRKVEEIVTKLGAKNRTQAVVEATKLGLV